MKKLIGFVSVAALIGGMSCKPEVTVNPTITIADTVVIDPDIQKFATFLTTTWRVEKVSFTPTYDYIQTASINCSSEMQFAYLKEFEVSKTNHPNVLKVENTYLCSDNSSTTYFHLEKIECCGFTITEKDEINQVIRVFDFIATDGHSIWQETFLSEKGHLELTMFCRTFDPTMFNLMNPGSLTSLPSIYLMYIEKNF